MSQPLPKRRVSPLRKVLNRDRVNVALDELRFRIDSFPARDTVLGAASYVRYQPLPWLGRPEGRRGAGTYSRWSAMEPVVDELSVQSAVDLGANAGFFTFSLAAKGIPTLAVEDDPTFVRTAAYVSRRTQFSHAGVLKLRLDPQTVRLIPNVDAILCLSLWHHFVRGYGFDEATLMLSEIWQRTGRVLFFDTGENEMPASFGLPPMTPTPREWLTSYLEESCPESQVRYLGQHAGFYESDRSLFAVVRRLHE